MAHGNMATNEAGFDGQCFEAGVISEELEAPATCLWMDWSQAKRAWGRFSIDRAYFDPSFLLEELACPRIVTIL